MKKLKEYLNPGSSCWAEFIKMGALLENSPTNGLLAPYSSINFLTRDNNIS